MSLFFPLRNHQPGRLLTGLLAPQDLRDGPEHLRRVKGLRDVPVHARLDGRVTVSLEAFAVIATMGTEALSASSRVRITRAAL